MTHPDCEIEIKVHYGKCESPDIDITENENYACIVKLFDDLLELRKDLGDLSELRICMNPALQRAMFPNGAGAMIIRGWRLPVVALDEIEVEQLEDGSLRGEIEIYYRLRTTEVDISEKG